MKIVLDTNIFIATLVKPNSTTARLYWLWREGRYTLLTSEDQLDELRNVSRRPKFKGVIRPHQAGAMMNTLKTRATVLAPREVPDVSPDSDDNLIIAVALYGKADYLASLNMHDVVKLVKVGSTRILHSKTLLKRLE